MKNVFDTAEEYIEFFDKIPDEKWCEGSYEPGQTCALGHLTKPNRGSLFDHPFRYFLGDNSALGNVISVNDASTIPDFAELGDTPKERVLNALVLKAAGVWDEIV